MKQRHCLLLASAVTVWICRAQLPGALDQARALVEERRNMEAAKRALTALIATDPRSAEAYYLIARVQYDARDFAAATKNAETAVSLDAVPSAYRLLLGKCYAAEVQSAGLLSKMGLAHKAKAEFDAAVKADPRSVPARRALAGFLEEAPSIAGGGSQKAFEQADEIERIDRAEGHYTRADLFSDQVKVDDMTRECKLAMDANSSNPDLYVRVGMLCLRNQVTALGRTAIEKAYSLDPENPSAAYYVGAWRLVEGKQLDTVEALLRLSLARWQTENQVPHAAAHWRLGQLYAKQGKLPAAIQEYETALQMAPKFAQARKELDALKHGRQEAGKQ